MESLYIEYLNPIKFVNILMKPQYIVGTMENKTEWYQYLLSTYFIESPAHTVGQHLAVPIPSGSISAASSMDVCK